MADFKEAKFGDKFKYKKTGEICELVSTYQSTVNLKPLGYKGMMTYNLVVGCPNSLSDWELVESSCNWTIHTQRHINTSGWIDDTTLVYSNTDMKLLKEKLLGDLSLNLGSIIKDGVTYITSDRVEEVINKRFGFRF